MPRDDNDDVLCQKLTPSEATVIASGFSEDFMAANRHIYKLLTSGVRKELRILNIRMIGRDVWIKCETPDQASSVIDFLNSRRFTKAHRSTEPAPAKEPPIPPQRPPHLPSDSYRDGRPITPRSASHQSSTPRDRSPRRSSFDRPSERSSPAGSPRSSRSHEDRKRAISFDAKVESESDRSRRTHRDERPRTPTECESNRRSFEHPPPLQSTGTEEEDLDEIEHQRVVNNHFLELAALGKKSLRDVPRQVSVSGWRDCPCSEVLLFKLFAPFGGIWSARVSSPSQGYVTFVHPGSAQAAVHFASVTGLFVNDARLTVSVAQRDGASAGTPH